MAHRLYKNFTTVDNLADIFWVSCLSNKIAKRTQLSQSLQTVTNEYSYESFEVIKQNNKIKEETRKKTCNKVGIMHKIKRMNQIPYVSLIHRFIEKKNKRKYNLKNNFGSFFSVKQYTKQYVFNIFYSTVR